MPEAPHVASGGEWHRPGGDLGFSLGVPHGLAAGNTAVLLHPVRGTGKGLAQCPHTKMLLQSEKQRGPFFLGAGCKPQGGGPRAELSRNGLGVGEGVPSPRSLELRNPHKKGSREGYQGLLQTGDTEVLCLPVPGSGCVLFLGGASQLNPTLPQPHPTSFPVQQG